MDGRHMAARFVGADRKRWPTVFGVTHSKHPRASCRGHACGGRVRGM
jgi:hypothetical protein